MRSLRWGAFVSWLIVAGLAIGGFAAFSPDAVQPALPPTPATAALSADLGGDTGRVIAIAFAAASYDRTDLTVASALPTPTGVALGRTAPKEALLDPSVDNPPPVNPTTTTEAQTRAAPTPTAPPTTAPPAPPVTWPSGTTCLASWYGDAFAGRSTASGEPFDPSDLTAALHEVPFGTMVTVTRLDTGASVIVRINDRGPYEWRGGWYRHPDRCIDLSEAAMSAIGGVGAGIVPVTIEY